jgi:hypothetical protein
MADTATGRTKKAAFLITFLIKNENRLSREYWQSFMQGIFMNSGYWNWNIFFPSQVVGNNPDMGQDGH